ncbi:MAG: hypothetical protein H8F28_08095 [Fibrella sp.]|nr:hypothetical protein [Armatimonadota bacterium]
MSNYRIYLVACAICSVCVPLIGCGNNQSGEQAAAAKAQPALKDNPTVPAEVKAQVEAAKQGEVQKMDQYAKDMAAKYKNNPPVAK